MKIEETADKTVRGPWRFELDKDRPINASGEVFPSYYTGNVAISLGDGIGVVVSPDEAEMIAEILRDFAGRARRQAEGDR